MWGRDSIQVNGREIPGPRERIYLLLNKPFGYVCSLKDPQGRPVVTELLHGIGERVYPVGRLDFDSMGLLLFTNDGDWAYRLMHPRFRIPRTYKVTIAGELSQEALLHLRDGVQLEDGRSYRARVARVQRGRDGDVLRVIIAQGKSRQVRRMLAAVGCPVVHLIRTHFGNLSLGDLKVGQYRHLTPEEVQALSRLVGLKR
jgi:pseudouridine synthase